MKLLVRCRAVVCRLGGVPVLEDVDFDVSDGDAVALLGRSGSGKSTLLRIIAGLHVPESGEVAIAGQPATAGGRLMIPAHRRGVAMLFQDLALWPNLSVAGNVRLGLSGLRLSRRETQERIEHALRLCGIVELARRRPGTLSGGQQQRAALARALAMRPKLLLLDEPFGGLDLVTKQSVIEQIARLKQQLGFALILVTHDCLEVRSLCRSFAVLEDGCIAEHRALDEPAAAQSPLGRAFLQALHRVRSEHHL